MTGVVAVVGGSGVASTRRPWSQRSAASPTSRRFERCRSSASRCYDVKVAKTRTTLTIDDGVLRAVKVRAARTGKGDGEVIEEALRRHLGLDLLDRVWERNELSEVEAVDLAVEAQHRTRRRKR